MNIDEAQLLEEVTFQSHPQIVELFHATDDDALQSMKDMGKIVPGGLDGQRQHVNFTSDPSKTKWWKDLILVWDFAKVLNSTKVWYDKHQGFFLTEEVSLACLLRAYNRHTQRQVPVEGVGARGAEKENSKENLKEPEAKTPVSALSDDGRSLTPEQKAERAKRRHLDAKERRQAREEKAQELEEIQKEKFKTELRPWQKFNSWEGFWWWNEADNSYFFEHNPGLWENFTDPATDTIYWWHSETGEFFWDK